jgi:hypothetical protein
MPDLVAAAQRLSGILNQNYAVLLAKSAGSVDVARLPVKVHGEQSLWLAATLPLAVTQLLLD